MITSAAKQKYYFFEAIVTKIQQVIIPLTIFVAL